MRLLLLSTGACVLACGALLAQAPPAASSGAKTTNVPQIPVGQTYKDFQFPIFQNGQLSYTLSAISATGTTLNRAATTDLKIDIYTNGKVTTTITSPKADIYVAERVMRTKDTVDINRADLEATSQSCDFDLINKKFLLRDKVRVLLKNFNVGAGTKPPAPIARAASSGPLLPAPATQPDDAPLPHTSDSLLDMPGAVGTTNSTPIAPPNPGTP